MSPNCIQRIRGTLTNDYFERIEVDRQDSGDSLKRDVGRNLSALGQVDEMWVRDAGEGGELSQVRPVRFFATAMAPARFGLKEYGHGYGDCRSRC